MAALTLGEWRDWTLEQVHFAAQEALDAVVVQGNPRMREWVAAPATRSRIMSAIIATITASNSKVMRALLRSVPAKATTREGSSL
jgi:hypothetical protein